MKKIIIIVISLGVALAGAWSYRHYQATGSPLPQVSLAQNETLADEEPDQLFKNLGPAPELTGLTKWLGSDPVTLQSLRGKVVLVNFWTYSCINCIRSLPYYNKWSVDYQDRGFAIVSIHTPEFAFEKIPANVEAAVKRYSISYPVAMDNNYKTWTAFHNQFWPAAYLIDKNGDIVYTNYGESNFDRTEKAIRTLVGLEGPFDIPNAPTVSTGQTPEIYLGMERLKYFGGTETPNEQSQIYTFPKKLAKNKFALEGNWQFTQEAMVHNKGYGRIKLNFSSAKVFMVAQSSSPLTLKIYVDGQLAKGVVVGASDIYQLFDSLSAGTHTMEIEIPAPQTGGSFDAFAFTFN